MVCDLWLKVAEPYQRKSAVSICENLREKRDLEKRNLEVVYSLEFGKHIDKSLFSL
jgi:hypothetical protein